MKFAPILLALAIGLAAPASAAPTTANELVAAERSFVESVGKLGFKRGFLAFVAPDAISFRPGPINAKADLEAQPDAPDSGPPVVWWPAFAAISRSGDLGFTTGGANIPLQYFTVWQRQSDGSWKWIYDGGPGLKTASDAGKDGTVAFLPIAKSGSRSRTTAVREVSEAESRLNAELKQNTKAALLKVIAPEARLFGSAFPPATGGAEQVAELERRPANFDMRPLKAISSAAGDLVFTYGEARWTRDGEARWGHYVRFWQKQSDGWKLVLDYTLRAPGQPPALP